jgi:DNA-directed RNA polymerase specialized sigma24 family protein
MAEDPRRKALKEAGRAQAQFEKSQQRLDDLGTARRKRFRQAAVAGASMAEIAEAVGLHRSRVNQIIHGK